MRQPCAISRYVQQQVQMLDRRISMEMIRDELSKTEASILKDKNTLELFKMPSKISRRAASIYRAMGVFRDQNSIKISKM